MGKKRVLISLLGALTALSMMTSAAAFAAEHDPTEDIAGVDDTATITVGKILTVSQENHFPDIDAFDFTLERVTGWDNANVTASENGKQMDKSEVPMPEAAAGIAVSGDTAVVTVDGFDQTAAGDSAVKKTRTKDVAIHFTKAGYYVYRLTENVPQQKAAGVTYDEHEYFVVVYVTNRTDADGNTASGVYVHDITSWRNEEGSSANQADLSDLRLNTDNNGAAALENDEDTLGKVGKSNPPNKLEAYRFWNSQETHDIVIEKNVTGNLGDLTKEFAFTVTLEGLEPGVCYTSSTAAETGAVTDGKLVSASVGTADTAARTITADETGKAVFVIHLRDGERFVVNGLPVTATYQICEEQSDHKASYAISATGENAVILKAEDANQNYDTALATGIEVVDPADGTVTVLYTNHKETRTITGLANVYGPWAAAGAAIAAGFIVFLARRKEEQEY